MGLTRQKLLQEIEIQEETQGSLDNKELMLKIVNACKTSNEIDTFFRIEFHRYGKLSYETHRFYFVKDNMLELLNSLKVN